MNPKSGAKDFPVVCVGGSAGGLGAYARLFKYLPTNLGVATRNDALAGKAVLVQDPQRAAGGRIHKLVQKASGKNPSKKVSAIQKDTSERTPPPLAFPL